MSQLKVNSIVPVGGLPSGANGGIIQVVQTVKTDTASSTADSFTNIGPTVAITPSSNSNKVLVRFTMVGFGSNDNWAHFFRLARGGTAIGVGATDSNRTLASTVIDTYGGGSIAYVQTSFEFLDSPATTSATTYSIQHKRAGSSAGTFYLGRNDNSSDDASQARFPTIITAMEVTV
tara:strand:+ start:2096 stop:2623 length:528 start_codon:yes stop_codon:yes gene_type:complete